MLQKKHERKDALKMERSIMMRYLISLINVMSWKKMILDNR